MDLWLRILTRIWKNVAKWGGVSLPKLYDVIHGRPLINPKITHLQCEQGKPLLEWLVMCRFKCEPLPNLVITSISAFLILDVQSPQMIQLFVFQTHKMCYKYVVCIIFTSDRILHRQILVLRCALAPDADADVSELSCYFEKYKIKPVSGAPWFGKKSRRRRRAPPRCTSRARVACGASSLPCCCCRLSSLRC